MQKIASPQELQAELRRILASTEGPERPSREALAIDLNELADRIDGKKVAGRYLTDPAYETHENWQRDIGDIYKHREKAEKAIMELEDAVGGLQREAQEAGHDQKMLGKHLNDLAKALQGGVLDGRKALREFEGIMKRFHGPDNKKAAAGK